MAVIKMYCTGNLGKDCVTNSVNGKNVINFSIAVGQKYKNSQGEYVEKTIWVDAAYWSDNTKIADYLLKGQQVFVEGTPEVKTYQKSDGGMGASLSLRVSNIQLLGGKPQAKQAQPQVSESDKTFTEDNSGLPF